MSDELPGANAAPEPAASAAEPPKSPSKSVRDRIIDAVMELAAEREWQDFSLTDVAERAGVSLAEFRDTFPSKGAVLAGLSRKIDGEVLRNTGTDLSDESAKERLFDVLMRRLDAMTPYKLGLQGVADWVRRDPLAATALNGVAVNSMRFMLEAAGIDTEKRAGALKIQGLVLAWARVLSVWFKDDEPGLARTMAALDRELTRGESLAGRVDDVDRLLSPIRLLAQSVANAGQKLRNRQDRRATARNPDPLDTDPVA